MGLLDRERDPLSIPIDLEHLNGDLVAHLDHLGRVIDVLIGEFGDVDESVHAAEVDECSEVDHGGDDALPDLADFEIVEERLPLLGLRLFEIRPARQHDVVAIAVQFDDLGFDRFTDVRIEIAHSAQLDERGREESAKADVDDQAALDDLDDRTA